MRVVFFTLALSLCGLGLGNIQTQPTQTDPQGSYLKDLSSRAKALKLGETTQWRRLLYIIPGWLKKQTSLVDEQSFFLSTEGKDHPDIELEATLESFFWPIEKQVTGRRQHPQCAYPARFRYLNEQLHFDFTKMEQHSCPILEKWMKDLDGDKISLVFSAGFLNNPASMFGHTLLRIHRRQKSNKSQALLDHAVNFAAYPFTFNPVLYPVFGLFGRFPGRFDLMPYFMKVQEYNNSENRDLWEYELTLKPEQVELILLSLWEMSAHRIDYYYFDDNCALLPLVVLEVGDPELKLTAKFDSWVIPSDTVRAVANYPGLVKKVHYRPSSASTFIARYESLSSFEKKQVDQLVSDTERGLASESLLALNEESKASVVDTTLDFIDYNEKVYGDKLPVKMASFRRQLLAYRSRVDAPLKKLEFTPVELNPSLGHNASRIGLGQGGDRNGLFSVFEWRPALHDIGASTYGYSDELEIKFMNFEAAYDWKRKNIQLRRFDLLEILSLASFKPLITPLSWRASLGVERDGNCGEKNCLKEVLEVGFGASVRPFQSRLSLHVLGLASVGFSNRPNQYFHAGPGVMAGAIWKLDHHFKLSTMNLALYRLSQENYFQINSEWQAIYSFNPEYETRLTLTYQNRTLESLLTFYRYF